MPNTVPENTLFCFMLNNFGRSKAGIKNPDHVNRNIVVLPNAKSLTIITARTNNIEYFAPKYAAAKSMAPVTNSKFGPRSKNILSAKASEASNTSAICLFIWR